MIKHEVSLLPSGLYKITWKESRGGGQSLAAVGVTANGGRWLAPINWIAPTTDQIMWRAVERAERIS